MAEDNAHRKVVVATPPKSVIIAQGERCNYIIPPENAMEKSYHKVRIVV